MMKISLILEAVNRVSRPVEAVNKVVKKVGATIAQTSRTAAASFGRIGMGADALARRLGESMGKVVKATVGAERATIGLRDDFTLVGAAASAAKGRIGAYVAAVRRVATVAPRLRPGFSVMGAFDTSRDALHHWRGQIGDEGIARAGRSVGYLRNQVSGLTSGFTLLKYASIAAGIGLGEEFVRGVFKAGGEMQQMLVTLTRLEGSATKAKASMAWMQTFAMGAGAAFSFPDIMRSYQMAQNFGMRPQGGSLAAFADLAAGERVPLKQVLIAVKDAMEGTSTRPLANLGIKMKQGKGGGPNSYLYSDAGGKFITETSAKTPEATLATLVKIINSKYAGLATAQAATVPGGLAQMQKLLYLFEGKVAGAGVFDWALKQMNAFFAFVRRASADGSLDRWAKKISDFMTGAGDRIIGFVKTADWGAVGKDIGVLGGSLVLVAQGLNLVATLGGGGMSGLLNLFVASKVFGFTQAILGLIALLPGLGAGLSLVSVALVGVDLAVLPIDAVIAAIAALAAVVWLVYANWDGFKAWWKDLWDSVRSMSPSSWADLIPWILNPAASLGAAIGRAFAGSGGAQAAPAGPKVLPGRGAPALLRAPPGSPAAAANGKLTIELVGSGASAAQIKALKATGMDIDVKRGPVNGQPG